MNSTSPQGMAIEYDKLIKESLITAFVVFFLTLTMVGFYIVDIPGGLELNYRFFAVGFVTVLAFGVRFVLLLQDKGRPLPVIVFGGVCAIALLISIMAGFNEEGIVNIWLPFGEIIVNWILFLFLSVITARGIIDFSKKQAGAYSDAKKYKNNKADVLAIDSKEDKNKLGAFVQKNTKYIAPIFLGFAILAPLFAYAPEEYRWMDRRLIDISVLVITYIMLGWGLNIVVGLAGLLDLGYVAFYAVGAYSYALLSTTFDVSFWVALPFAGLMAATFGILLGFPVLRLRGDYLAIVTLGFGEIIRVILINWYDFTNGPDGISGIARPSFFGLEFKRKAPEGVETFHTFFDLEFASIDKVVFLYYLILIMALLTNWFTIRIRRLPIGRAWEALREDEIACRSLGINPTNTKLTAFSIGAMFGGFAGSFFATRQGFISPESFTFFESAIILGVVVLGGMGSQLGIVFAAILLIGLPEFFRELHQYRMLAFGGAMVLIMLWRPSGLLAFREPTIRLFAKVGGVKNSEGS